MSRINARWRRVLALVAAAALVAGGAVTGLGATVAYAAAPAITTHPAGRTVSVGGTATFTAAASSAVSVKWQSTKAALANGEPNDSTWTDVPGSAEATLTVAATDADAQNGTFYRAVFTNADGSANSYSAQLRFYEKLDTGGSVSVSGESYGPIQPNQPFSVSTPNAVVKGQPIGISGSGYLATDGTTGSVAAFMIDASYSGDPNTVSTTRQVTNPVTGVVSADKRLHGIVQAGADGTWQISIPWPDETNTTKDAAFFASNWTAGTQHMVRILTGSLLPSPADYQRGISVRFTVVDQATTPTDPDAPTIALTRTSVEQGEHVWFDLADFAPGAAITAELVNSADAAVAQAGFTIGPDGRIANPGGQTYQRVTAPRNAPLGEYRVRVRAGGDVLVTSDPVQITAATTRVYNPGDHAGGAEDLLVQRGGTWTFLARAFTPGGVLRATAQVGGQTVQLSGIGQISGTNLGWQLDGNGDADQVNYTRLQLPAAAPQGDFTVTFSDGTKTVERTLTIQPPAAAAAVTVAPSATFGGTIRVTGTGFFHPTSTAQGSRIGVKIDDGAYSRLDTAVHANRTIWYIINAGLDGTFDVQIPLPNGTTADDAANGTSGSDPALPAGEHTLRFLTGSLLSGDTSRTLQSTPFTVRTAGKDLTKTPTPKISGTGKVGKTLTAKAGTWKPAKVKLAYQWLRDGEPIAKATKSKYKLTKADAGRRITVAVTGSKSGYESVTKISAAKSVAKVKATVSLSAPKKLAPGLPFTATVKVKAPVANPAGTVKLTVNGQTVTADLTAENAGAITVDLPAFPKKGSYKVKASFTPTGDTAVSTSASSTVSKTVKVR